MLVSYYYLKLALQILVKINLMILGITTSMDFIGLKHITIFMVIF